MTYEFKCVKCKTRSWISTSMEDIANVIFPKCNKCGSETKRVFDAPEVVFKGKGFYSTDKRNNNGKDKVSN
jgi:putative FmdB family regulatory protein